MSEPTVAIIPVVNFVLILTQDYLTVTRCTWI